MTVQDTRGALVYANGAALELLGFETLDGLLSARIEEVLARFELFDEAGDPLTLAELPGRHILRGEPGRGCDRGLK